MDGRSVRPDPMVVQVLMGKWLVMDNRLLADAGLRVEYKQEGPAQLAMRVMADVPGFYYVHAGIHTIGIVTEIPSENSALSGYYFLDPHYGVRTTMLRKDLAEVPALVEQEVGSLPGYKSTWKILKLAT